MIPVISGSFWWEEVDRFISRMGLSLLKSSQEQRLTSYPGLPGTVLVYTHRVLSIYKSVPGWMINNLTTLRRNSNVLVWQCRAPMSIRGAWPNLSVVVG